MKKKNLILPSKMRLNPQYKSLQGRCAVVTHLYYLDTLEQYYKYINIIPDDVDVYVTYSNEQVKQKGKLMQHRPIYYVKCKNHGRDISALLVAMRKTILQYDYICFVHDKKSKSKAKENMTTSWIRCLWTNLLGGAEYINNIINVFDENSNCGLIVPPLPVDDLNPQMYTDQWNKNILNMEQLAVRLKLNIPIDVTEQIDVLGTAFWARTKALYKLLQYQWEYEDFVEEPMPGDGTISHAIERIFPYVVKDAGYETFWTMTSEYASEYIDVVRGMLQVGYGLLDEELGIRTAYEAKRYKEEEDRLKNFIRKCQRSVCIYGAGEYGISCYKMLKHMGEDIKYFIVTNINQEADVFCMGKPVKHEKDVDWKDFKGVIIAVSEVFREEILEKVNEKDCTFIVFTRLPEAEE